MVAFLSLTNLVLVHFLSQYIHIASRQSSNSSTLFSSLLFSFIAPSQMSLFSLHRRGREGNSLVLACSLAYSDLLGSIGNGETACGKRWILFHTAPPLRHTHTHGTLGEVIRTVFLFSWIAHRLFWIRDVLTEAEFSICTIFFSCCSLSTTSIPYDLSNFVNLSLNGSNYVSMPIRL